MKIEEVYEPMDLHFCIRYWDLIPDADKKRKVKGLKHDVNRDPLFAFEQVIKLHEIFALTPKSNDSMDECFLREGSHYELINVKGDECLKYFSVERMVFLEYICYKLSARVNQTASRSHYAVSPVFSGKTSQFVLKNFKTATICKIALAPHNSDPYSEISVAPQWLASNRAVMVKPSSIRSHLLPWPYSSDCVDYTERGFASRTDCYTSCVYNQTLHKLNKLPNSALLDEQKSSLTIVSYLDLLNKSIAPVVRSIEQQCSDNCSREDCNQHLVVSNLVFNSLSWKTKENDWFISVLIPVDPSIEIRTAEKMTLVEYLILFLSTVSTWTSLSVLSLDPLKLFARKSVSTTRVIQLKG